MKQRNISYRLEGEIGTYNCTIMANDWYHLKAIVDGLLSYYKGGDIVSINEIDD